MRLAKAVSWAMATGAPIQIMSPYDGKLIHSENTLTKAEVKEVLTKTATAR